MIYKSTLSLIPCRKDPSDQSEMVTQLLYGELFEITETLDNWIKIKTLHDQYESYIDKKQGEEAQKIKSNTVNLKNCIHTPIYIDHHKNEPNILFAGSLVENEPIKSDEKNIEKITKQFLNAPYLWGGRTVAGIDCSGFTQLIYRLLEKNIPRDAYQQAELGDVVSFVTETKTGDLAFFDNAEGRITHVGIVLKSGEDIHIIHASGKVRIDKLDHHGIFDADKMTYSHQLRIIKRLM